MKKYDTNKFLILIFCFIRNKPYLNDREILLITETNAFILCLHKDYFDDERYYISKDEFELIIKKKTEYESKFAK